MTTSTNSNFVMSEIFSDNYNTEDSKLMSQRQNKLLSQKDNKTKDNNEKQG